MEEKAKTTSNPRSVSARVTRPFDTSPERVFDAWITPEKVRQWFAPGLGEIVRVTIEARIGGSFSFVQRRSSLDVDHTGEYLEMDRPRRLVFTWRVPPSPDTSRVIVEIALSESGSGSEVTVTHELHPAWADYAGRAESAWTQMLDAMAATLAP